MAVATCSSHDPSQLSTAPDASVSPLKRVIVLRGWVVFATLLTTAGIQPVGCQKGRYAGNVKPWKLDLVFIQDWMVALPRPYRLRVVGALDQVAVHGPILGRPLVDRIHGSRLHNLKELRPVTNKAAHLRVLFVFTPSRTALMLTAEDKWGRWGTWYDEAIAEAEANYDRYTTN